MNTPDLITELAEGEVFVFGSNAYGFHGGGAAAVAWQHFGAVWGYGEGLQGRSYAIPTMEGLVPLQSAVQRFLAFAAEHPELTFLVTKIGTGIAGHPIAAIAPLFAGRTANVVIPIEFEQQQRQGEVQ
jgi:hypothetical protein